MQTPRQTPRQTTPAEHHGSGEHGAAATAPSPAQVPEGLNTRQEPISLSVSSQCFYYCKLTCVLAPYSWLCYLHLQSRIWHLFIFLLLPQGHISIYQTELISNKLLSLNIKKPAPVIYSKIKMKTFWPWTPSHTLHQHQNHDFDLSSAFWHKNLLTFVRLTPVRHPVPAWQG